jgi:hypothetical protein
MDLSDMLSILVLAGREVATTTKKALDGHCPASPPPVSAHRIGLKQECPDDLQSEQVAAWRSESLDDFIRK